MAVNKFHRFVLESKNPSVLFEEDGVKTGENTQYVSCAIEAIDCINQMLAEVTKVNTTVAESYISRRKALADNLQTTLKSHGTLWVGINQMARDLERAIEPTDITKDPMLNPKKAEETLEDLAKQLEDKKITEKEYEEKVKAKEARTTAEQIKKLYFEKNKEAFNYFSQAVKAFYNAALSILKAANGQVPDWLDKATESIQNMLNKE